MSPNLLQKIHARLETAEPKKVLAGFDGYIDTIAKPVISSGGDTSGAVYFKTIAEFGTFISSHANKSSSIELDILEKRIGGNMPNFARALGNLGADVSGIGMLGDGKNTIDPAFKVLPVQLFSYAPAGTATALEFSDGKIFLAPRYSLDGDPVALLRKALEPGSIKDSIREANLMAFLNWGELAYSNALWQAFYQELRSSCRIDKNRFIFFDLSDFNRRTNDELSGAMELIEQFTEYRSTILSLNGNEAAMLFEKTRGQVPGDMPVKKILEILKNSFHIDDIIIHQHHESFLFCDAGIIRVPVMRVNEPRISTGAGDNFNAAYCFARLLELDAEERLSFANLYARNYISSGVSLKLESLHY